MVYNASTMRSWPLILLAFALALVIACNEPAPTPEAPGILATVQALPTPRPPTPEGPGILATLQAMPTPLPVTPEGPSIMATVLHLLATPTSTPLPTNTPGPTPTPRASESSTFLIGGSVVRSIPVRLSPGERMEGYYQSPKADITLVIQDPSGNIVRDYGRQATSNFQASAEI